MASYCGIVLTPVADIAAAGDEDLADFVNVRIGLAVDGYADRRWSAENEDEYPDEENDNGVGLHAITIRKKKRIIVTDKFLCLSYIKIS